MLGWRITVSSLSPELKNQMPREEQRGYDLATWETGLGGTGWLEALAAEGKATWDKSNDGYPWRFIAKAADVLPVLTGGLPRHEGILVIGTDPCEEYVTPAGWSSQVQLRPENIAQFPLDAMLTIDAWDQS